MKGKSKFSNINDLMKQGGLTGVDEKEGSEELEKITKTEKLKETKPQENFKEINNKKKKLEEINPTIKNRIVKKTFEVNFCWDLAIEKLKNKRKLLKKIGETNQATTYNGIINEIIEDYFKKKENEQIIQEVINDLT